MKLSSFTVILSFCILMVIGVALVPLLDVGVEPVPRQGKTIKVKYSWPHTSAKVIEQNLTSPVEGMLAALKGVESVSSKSSWGRSEIYVKLKESAKVSSVRFEISSMLRQSYERLPEGISYPDVSGGEVVYQKSSRDNQQLLLTYLVNADMQTNLIGEYVTENLKRPLEMIEGVSKVEVTGTNLQYQDVVYDPIVLANYGITSEDIMEGIRKYLGEDEILGIIENETTGDSKERIMLHLSTEAVEKNLGEMPLKRVGEKIIYLNDLAKISMKDVVPDRYYRINGMSTIYVNVYMPMDGKAIVMSDKVQEKMAKVGKRLNQKMMLTLSYDRAQEQRNEMESLVWRTLMSIFVLLALVLVVSRKWKYLSIVSITLTANLLVAIIVFWVFGLQLHVYSLAGITVSMGLVIDSTIVMVDHYGYYHNRKAFWSIWAAMLTTIGSMVVIFFLPSELQKDLYDFAWIIIANLFVSLLVAYFFVPAIIDKFHYITKRHQAHHARWIVRWNNFYVRYILLFGRFRWLCLILIFWALGFPFRSLPDSFEYKEILASYLGGTSQMFADYLSDGSNQRREDGEAVKLYVSGQMPIGGTAAQLNQKMIIIEEFLKKYDGIKDFVTRIDGKGGTITISFKKDVENTGFPYQLENELIGKLISLGGADWATHGVSERGFSNSLNLQHRSERIVLKGYNYAQLYRLAENLCDALRLNKRVQDILIETPGYENQEDEVYMGYKKDRMVLYGIEPNGVYQKVRSYTASSYVGSLRGQNTETDVYITPQPSSTYDIWHMENEQMRVDSSELFLPDMMAVNWREAKNVIPKENQQYVLNVAFNVLGSYAYTEEYIEQTVDAFKKTLAVGYSCEKQSYRNPASEESNYWFLLLVAVVVFFICSIHFESLRFAWTILSVVPMALMGAFLSFCLTGVEFGSGGFASLVMLVGIVVNSGIYILSQYRIVLRHSHRSSVSCYICAYNHKIIPIMLTVLSTMMGMIPFLIDGKEEPFWFSFAVGVIGGLLFSVIALIFVMPIFLSFRKKTLMPQGIPLSPSHTALIR